MRKPVTFSLVFATILSFTAWAQAQAQPKPLVVVSASSFDRLKSNLTYLMKAAEQGATLQAIEPQLDLFSNGLDKQKPWGATVSLSAQNIPTFLAFVPVKNLNTVLNQARGMGLEIEDAGGGIKRIRDIVIKEQDGYAFIAQQANQLRNLPDPVKTLAAVDPRYDLSVTFFMQNLSKDLKNLGMTYIRAAMEESLEEKRDDESDIQFEIRKKMASQQLKQLEQVFNEVDKFGLGWTTDPKSKRTYLDMTIHVVPGTALAEQTKSMKQCESRFTSLIRPEAVFSASVARTLGAKEIEEVVEQMKVMRQTLMESIEDSETFDSDEDKNLVKGWVSQAYDLVSKTIERGAIDAFISVDSQSGGPLTLLTAMQLADGQAAEKLVKQVLQTAEKKNANFPKVQYNVAQHRGVNLHALKLPMDDEEVAKNLDKVFGENPMLYVGFSHDTMWFCLGGSAQETLKNAINASGERRATMPMQMSVSVSSILRVIGEVSQNPQLVQMAALVPAGSDRIRILVEGIENGQRLRMEIEESAIKLFGVIPSLIPGGGGLGGDL